MSGYWGAGNAGGFGGRVSHWWLPGEGKDMSLCGIAMRPIDIVPEWGRQRCKRCVKALIAMEDKDDEK